MNSIPKYELVSDWVPALSDARKQLRFSEDGRGVPQLMMRT